MRRLDFTVEGQKLSKEGDFSHIVKGSKGYLKCNFLLRDNDWATCKIAVAFSVGSTEIAVRLEPDRTCVIPDEITDKRCFKVQLIGLSESGTKILTNKVIIEQEG